MNSAIYAGKVWHQRYTPRPHRFSYRLFMLYLDTAELPELFDGMRLWSARGPALGWFRADDHIATRGESLDQQVRTLVATQTGVRPSGPIRLLTQLRYFGYYMNPLCIYYCWDSTDSHVTSVVAEVSNTPWGEKHWYVLSDPQVDDDTDLLRFTNTKSFHVSPFMALNQNYHWAFATPSESLGIKIENHEAGAHLFTAGLALERQPLTSRNLNQLLLRHPFMTGKIIAAIYWQALRLWLKRTPVFNHPPTTTGKGNNR